MFLAKQIYKIPLNQHETTIYVKDGDSTYSIKGFYNISDEQAYHDYPLEYDRVYPDEYNNYNIPRNVWYFVLGYYASNLSVFAFTLTDCCMEYGKIRSVYGKIDVDDNTHYFIEFHFLNNLENQVENEMGNEIEVSSEIVQFTYDEIEISVKIRFIHSESEDIHQYISNKDEENMTNFTNIQMITEFDNSICCLISGACLSTITN